ncbi:MAG: TerB N-terminal domain-containing protein [Gemmatimonadaceae bacterium]
MVGWQSVVNDIMAAAHRARTVPSFDEQARAREVARKVADAKRIPLWPLVVAGVTLFLPYGFAWAAVVLALWLVVAAAAYRRASELARSLNEQSAQLTAGHQRQEAEVRSLVEQADQGDAVAMQRVLDRWRQFRPEVLRPFNPQLLQPTGGEWLIRGDALRREDIPHAVPRLGRGGRTVFDKRKAAEIDEDMTELNAAGALSVLMALFSGPVSRLLDVRLLVPREAGREMIPWVVLSGRVGATELQRALRSGARPSDVIRALGGDVGRCRNQRLTAAGPPVEEPSATPAQSTAARVTPAPLPTSRASVHASSRVEEVTVRDPYGERARPVDFGEPAPPPSASARAVPKPPAEVQARLTAPSPKAVRGQFSVVARQWADYPGDPSARFYPFKAYYSTYADMDAGQLKFYFKWRGAFRRGEVLETDLSYVFVHVYELLHLVGATSAAHAASELERLWVAYQTTYPKLGGYVVRWVADLYVTEVSPQAAVDWYRRAAGLGGKELDVWDDRALALVTDLYWTAGDYAGMPRPAVGFLTGEPRLGDNKFYREHNRDGWVDRGYREALAVADRTFAAQHGGSLRDAAVAANGLQPYSREPFQGAVYDWKRTPVMLGKVPILTPDSVAVKTFRGAVRYAENLLRAERGFGSKLRGVEVEPDLATALDAQFGGYVRATRPKAKVVIDPAKARLLSEQSVDVRRRLLEGAARELAEQPPAAPQAPRARGDAPVSTKENPGLPGPNVEIDAVNAGRLAEQSADVRRRPLEQTTPAAPGAVSPSPADDLVPAGVPSGLLTDLAAIRAALGGISGPARAILEAMAAYGWELPDTSALLASAAGGALLGPLVDEINERSAEHAGDVLLVHEGAQLVVQEDYRDEVHWVLRGSLDGFGDGSTLPPVPDRAGAPLREDWPDKAFGPVEMQALAIVAAGSPGTPESLHALAETNGLTPLLLLDRVNEAALGSSYGDICVDVGHSPPILLEDARGYVTELLERMGSANAPPTAGAS